ncbi:MAG: hypothetical protein K8R31_05590 [Bacteroidales bacterium]|nr:hypothetical protein [Bacteroidales bacterium]
MKKIKFILKILLPVFLFLISCEEDDSLPKPTTFIASDGTYIGVVHLAYAEVPGAEIYEVYRLNDETAEWQDISWTEQTNWDDNGWKLPNDKIIPGQVYQYKFRTHAGGPGFGPYSEIETGYAFDPEEVTITEVTRNYEESENTIIWTDPNDYEPIQNIVTKEYIVYYAEENYLDNDYEASSTAYYSYQHSIPSWCADKVLYYKIVIKYSLTSGWDYEVESDWVKEGTGNGGDDPDIISYTRTDLGTVVTSGEAIKFTEIKQNGSNVYLDVLEDVGVTGYGTPAVYMLSGSSWTGTGGTLPGDITNSTSIGNMGIALSSSKTYLAALDLDSIYIHESDGSTWSNNLAVGNMGFADSHSAIDIEVLNDELYLAAKVCPDWDLKIFKWTGTDWQTVGGDASGFITTGVDVFDITLENYGGTLYLTYKIKNADYNHTFHIKHLNGSIWDSDLEWTADYIDDLKIAKGSSNLYFISRSQSPASFRGGVYKVTSTTSVEELISENDYWFSSPYDITVDTDGNVIITSIKIESATLSYPNLSLYDGSNWNTISGDFSDGIEPISVHADGTDIYYVYGDKNNVTTWGDTKSIKSAKFTK